MYKYLQIAIDEARSARAEGNYPYGSVLVRGEEIIGIGRNHMNTHNDPTSHAEIEVIRAAGLQQTYADTVMYVCQRVPLHHVRGANCHAWNPGTGSWRKLARL